MRTLSRLRPLFTATLSLAALIVAFAGTLAFPDQARGEGKTLRLPIRSDGPKSLDPVQGSTTYDNRACCQIYETLLQYKYLVRPPQLEPLLLAEMPVSRMEDSRMVWKFRLKPGVRFHDDPCFPDGKGREIQSSDVFYSWKRMADADNKPKSWWLFVDTIVGFDAYRATQNAADTFNYDAPVEGFRVLSPSEFEVVLTQPVQRFLWLLAMFQTSIVPREAVEEYGKKFGRHPVGTGPFRMNREEDWVPGKSLVLHRNPTYHECTYPEEHMPEDVATGLTQAAGKRLPIVDRVEFPMYVQDQPMWLEFRAGNLLYTQVPDEYWDQAFTRRRKNLKKSLVKEGITHARVPLLDFIFRGFNMEDEVLGGYTAEKKALRQAICLALDWEEMNDTFYHGDNIIYDGPIPPGLDGFPKDGKGPVSFHGPDLQRARDLLAKAGYPDGKGLPPIEYYVSRGGNSPEQAEVTKRQLSKIGVKLQLRIVDFSTLIEAINNKKGPMFSFAWGSDYPDAENNLALFYGPNESPGSNHYNYKNAEYDRLYDKIRSMPPSPERTKIYEQMRDMVVEDCAFSGGMARSRNYLWHASLKNFKPTEDFYNWVKYLDIDESK